MKKLVALLIFYASLAACGVDGPPVPPDPEPEPAPQQASGLSVSGSFGVGVKR